MSVELRELYQQVIIDHGRNPRHFGEIKDCDHCQEGFNPLCGDQLTLYIKIDNDIISDIKFNGQGCAISMASASLMAQALKGLPVADAKKLFARFHAELTDEVITDKGTALGKLAVLLGVKEFPARVKCATLAWHTLKNALTESNQSACTE